MATPVAATDEIVRLHDEVVATQLDDTEALGRLAFRARGLAARRSGDFVAVFTAAKALTKSAARDDAVAFAMRAFNLRATATQGREALTAVCINLGLLDEALACAREIGGMGAFTDNKIAMDGVAAAAFLCGDVPLLGMSAARASSIEALVVPGRLLQIVTDNGLTELLAPHMAIVRKYTENHSCLVDIQTDDFDEYGEKLSVHLIHRLALPHRETMKLFDAMGEELWEFYCAAGRDDLPYFGAIVHDFMPMPSYCTV